MANNKMSKSYENNAASAEVVEEVEKDCESEVEEEEGTDTSCDESSSNESSSDEEDDETENRKKFEEQREALRKQQEELAEAERLLHAKEAEKREKKRQSKLSEINKIVEKDEDIIKYREKLAEYQKFLTKEFQAHCRLMEKKYQAKLYEKVEKLREENDYYKVAGKTKKEAKPKGNSQQVNTSETTELQQAVRNGRDLLVRVNRRTYTIQYDATLKLYYSNETMPLFDEGGQKRNGLLSRQVVEAEMGEHGHFGGWSSLISISNILFGRKSKKTAVKFVIVPE